MSPTSYQAAPPRITFESRGKVQQVSSSVKAVRRSSHCRPTARYSAAMRTTWAKLESNLKPIFYIPALGLAIAATFAVGCGGGTSVSGTAGTSGGTAGTTGGAGTTGSAGTTGTAGTSGTAGTTGSAGAGGSAQAGRGGSSAGN